MVLPLYLAMNASEITHYPLPEHPAWMACHFSPWTNGVSNLPASLPQGAILILNDRIPCQGHSADLVAAQLNKAVTSLSCESVLLDFQRPDNPETEAVVRAILEAVSCPVAVTEHYAKDANCPVFLGPNPLHIPLSEYLSPWQGREIWLEAGLTQERAAIRKDGTVFTPCFPPEGLDGGFFDETLCCRYTTVCSENAIEFTLFDTPESLSRKLDAAQALGVTRTVGLYQELGGSQFLLPPFLRG